MAGHMGTSFAAVTTSCKLRMGAQNVAIHGCGVDFHLSPTLHAMLDLPHLDCDCDVPLSHP